MKITMENIHRLCDETGMDFQQALSLLRQFDGDLRSALRSWQDERTIFIEPLQVVDCARPLSDRIHEAWKKSRSALRRIQPLRILAAAALIPLCRRMGGWLMLLPVIVCLLPLLRRAVSLLRRRTSAAAHTAA